MFCLQSAFTLTKAENSLICSSSTASSSTAFPFTHRAVCYQTQKARLSRIQLPKQRHLLTPGVHQYIPLGPTLPAPRARVPIQTFLYQAPQQHRITTGSFQVLLQSLQCALYCGTRAMMLWHVYTMLT